MLHALNQTPCRGVLAACTPQSNILACKGLTVIVDIHYMFTVKRIIISIIPPVFMIDSIDFSAGILVMNLI